MDEKRRFSLLYVEDEHTLRRLVEYRLSKDYDVRTAMNGEEALARIAECLPDLIISDIMMPIMDGFALQAELQNRKDTRAIPFIFLTAKADEYSRLKGMRTGVDDYITKPFDIERLLSRIERLLIRTYHFKTQGSRLTITFTRDRWGHLTPIEYALTARLGKQYIIEQSADRIVVRLESDTQFQAALDAVIPVLAALESNDPGEVHRLALHSKDGDSDQIEGKELVSALSEIQEKLNTLVDAVPLLHERGSIPDSARLSSPEEALVEAVRGGIRGMLASVLHRYLASGDHIGKVIDRVGLDIYVRFSQFFFAARGLIHLSKPSTSNPLLSSTDDKEENS